VDFGTSRVFDADNKMNQKIGTVIFISLTEALLYSTRSFREKI
jgi:hypothetical protein